MKIELLSKHLSYSLKANLVALCLALLGILCVSCSNNGSREWNQEEEAGLEKKTIEDAELFYKDCNSSHPTQPKGFCDCMKYKFTMSEGYRLIESMHYWYKANEDDCM
jgi:hypothetical protein